jgi:cytochrome b subunit of formate dehydrogenase
MTKAKNEPRGYVRFTLPQIVQHYALLLSFALLALTGLPQKFAGDAWAERLIALMGGIEITRLIHHVAAIVLAIMAILHGIEIFYKVFVLRIRWSIFPEMQDVWDALNTMLYNLGLRKEQPKFDRYSFEQKFEYWALIWGTIVMGITGFMLWNPIRTSQIMSGEIIPAAKAAHGAEAILAVLAILIWHTYNVHIKTFNKSIFTGRLTDHQMAEEHGAELERLRRGYVEVRPAPQVIARRQRSFIPVAAVITIVLVAAVYYFFTSYEKTAITTLPRRTPVPVFVRPTAIPPLIVGTTPAAPVAKVLPASHVGRTTCNVCHATGTAGPKNPADHAGREDNTCLACHKMPAAPAATTPAPTRAVLPTATPAVTPTPVAVTTPAVTPTPVAVATPATTPTAAAAKPLPASHAGRTTCNVCHATGAAGPKNPADHAGREDNTCLACHK